MSHFIALKGKGSSGKTDTIKLVFQLLQNKYPNARVNVLIPNTIDIKATMVINGHKVGIESQGDPSSRLKQSLSDFVNAGCSIIICATRSSGMTVGWVNDYSSGNQIDFIQQNYTSVANHSMVNNQTALHIISTAGL
ncbi:MAG: hypothetical protein Q7I89_09275 [Syntrophales bacterium]|nr:hypothetical protein [Syntrophales bacterium]